MLTGLGPLSVDMYLASLPSIGRLLDAPTSQVQLTISAYLVGFAMRAGVLWAAVRSPRPAAGAARRARHLSAGDAGLRAGVFHRDADRRALRAGGRRLGRERAGARGGARHVRGHAASAASSSRMAAIMALAPLVAPLIGGVLQTAFGWRSNFVALFCFGAAALDHGVVPAAGDAAPARAGAGVDRLDACAPIAAFSPTGLSSSISASRRAACAGCSPGFPAPPSCCRTSTACRRWRSAWRSRSARRAIMVGTVDRGALCDALGQRPDDGLRRRGDGARRTGDGAAARPHVRSAPAGVIAAIGLYTDRHGHDACRRRRPARCCPIPTAPAPRRRCSASSRRPRRRWSARSSATRSARRAWPLAIAMRADAGGSVAAACRQALSAGRTAG